MTRGDDAAREFRQHIEVAVLKVIKDLVKRRACTKERIMELAALVLERVRPGMSTAELYHAAVTLDDHHPELSPVVYEVMKHYEETHEESAVGQVSTLIKTGRYDEAGDMVKKVLAFKAVGN